MIIYKITNLINTKVYIGQTIRTLSSRWWDHCKPSSRSVISKAIRKYGKENFTYEVIDCANCLDELNDKEIHWISVYDSRNAEKGYNIAFGGENRIMTEVIKIKLSESNKGKKKPPISDEHRRKLSEAAKKRKISPETREKIRQSHIGLKPSDETRKKLSLAKKGKKRDKNINSSPATGRK
jgi:group I intron endonuclease